MSTLGETILVVVIVAVALVWAGRAIWRSVSGKDKCSSCGSSGDCPLVNNPDLIEELKQKDCSGKSQDSATCCSEGIVNHRQIH